MGKHKVSDKMVLVSVAKVLCKYYSRESRFTTWNRLSAVLEVYDITCKFKVYRCLF